MCQLLKTKEQLQKEYEDAKKKATDEGISDEIIKKVTTGKPFEGDNAPDVRALKVAWSRLHSRL